ncbi:phosphatidylinositol 4,5-bisphosphate 3-kinase catalytic subunit delta isoform-like isoform X2 [Dreissena polymorpha]|uniref:phosphatidylinositol 4,5-bisphosphate 3-kinase catalytic subunit delta isoform-like isoform X2 n=1 Tax=Dreissena polymorpha TaxID=45954 RepID=UPI002265379A|nr:phosphatidylinositol 4,5-bisphosphate 3-kinase catalytic subunit delta isoform-like isoform X2 [Dreissena polymorpha]
MAPTIGIVCFPDISAQVSDGKVQIDFLLPNGMFIQLNVDFNKPLDLIKQTLWESARNFPLYQKLKEKDRYFFEYLNRLGEREEVTDESLRLSEIRPIGRFLRLQERKDDSEKNTLHKQINALLGNKNLMEMHSIPRPEVDDFRTKMLLFTNSISQNRSAFEKRFPLQLRSSVTLPDDIRQRLNNGYLVVVVRIEETKSIFHIQCHIEESPELVVDNALRKWYNKPIRNSYDYILKVVGQEDYLYGKTPIHNFKYIYTCIQKSQAPQFWLVLKKSIWPGDPPGRPPKSTDKKTSVNKIVHVTDTLVWDIKSNFEVKVNCINSIEIMSDQMKDNIDKVKLFVGLYHGCEVLGNVQPTAEMPVVNGNCTFNLTLTFDLEVRDMQTASRLCFTLHGRMKGSKCLNPIAWVNLPVFDFRSRLLVGEQTYYMWPVTAELQLEETGCYPLGSVSLNPHGTIAITVIFSDYGTSPPIFYPCDDKIIECAADCMEPPGTQGSPGWNIPPRMLEILETILVNSCQSETLHEQDKELVWLSRLEIREKHPECLPLVLRSVKWSSHKDVSKMLVLLSTWPQRISVDSALELLDFNFPDRNVRKYAVDCLQQLRDDEVMLYLLQLVQALKYENYLYCPLAEFLLEKALGNQYIGQKLFWLLRSEVHIATVTVRFSLLLEIYLKMSPHHLAILCKQMEALNKINAVSQIVKNSDGKGNYKNMRDILGQKSFEEKLCELISPMSPLHKLKELSVDKCRYMDSKKRPLYLVWTNHDVEGPEVHIIYKNGDDLRQDMLTLQMLEVMDCIWQSEGLDLRLNAYGCIATGPGQGMIEVVGRAKTLAAIQKKSGAFDKCSLYDWLAENNKGQGQLDTAIEEFTLSCAGYTVATYVLGIGDRHNDNIMLKETGQLFHIDFGHFLGNFKSKLGVCRERVPVVLTTHFEYIITKGDTDRNNYKRFKDVCIRAYLALRRRGQLLIRLFMMMLTSGIPQLSRISDLDYIKKETLVLHLTEDEAARHFEKKMNESIKSMATKINWAIHSFAHN